MFNIAGQNCTAMTPVGYGGLSEQSFLPPTIGSMISMKLKEAESKVEDLQKLQILFAQNPALEGCINLMRYLQIG